MSEQVAGWPRPYYRGPGGRPFLFYAVFGAFRALPPLPREYHSEGVPAGMSLSHHARGGRPDVPAGFCYGFLWDELTRAEPALADAVRAAGGCLVLRGEVEDRADLDYLRDAVGLVAFLLDHGGVAVYDPQAFRWWGPGAWRDRLFRPGGPVPRQHAVILTSPEGAAPLAWFHTRGLRKFGRPDLSVRRVPPGHREAVTDLLDRFIEFQAFGGVIAEGQEVRMASLPAGMTCRHAGGPNDPDFNNAHVEITPPA